MKKTFKLKLLNACVIAALAATSPLASADSDDDDALGAISLEDLLNIEVVSATRSESKLSESPVPISVITAQEIVDSGLDNIPDVLARLAEIDVMRIGASQTEVSIRGKGINFNRRLLTLIDGRTEYNDLFGVTLWNAFPIAMDDIERIEVVRGPASALFGANAYSGVINIITKKVSETGGKVRYHQGDSNRHYANVIGRYGSETFSAKVSLTQQNLDNDSNVTFEGFNRIPTSTNFNASDDSLEWVDKANAQVNFMPTDMLDFKLAYGMTDGTHELFQQPGLPRSSWDIETDYLHFITNYHFMDGPSLQFNVYQNNFDYTTPLVPRRAQQEGLSVGDIGFFFPISDYVGDFSGETETFDYSIQLVGKAMDDRMNWVVGGERREIDNKGGIVLDSDKEITSFFGNFTLKMGEKWILGLGLRTDDDSETGDDLGYNTSIQYALNSTDSIRFTARSAFRAPSLFELNSSVDLPVPNQNQQVNFRGNTELDVETIQSVDLTYTMQIGDNIQTTFEVYREQYGNLIGNPDSGILDEVIITDEGLLVSTTSFQNLASAESEGFQASLVWLASKDLKTYANYRYANPKDLNNISGETFFTPENTFKLGVNWKAFDGFTADISYRSIGKTDESEFTSGNVVVDGPNFTRENQQAYNTLNIALHYRPDWIDGLHFYLVADNALDDKHVEYYEYDQILNGVGEEFGRTVWGGFSWNF